MKKLELRKGFSIVAWLFIVFSVFVAFHLFQKVSTLGEDIAAQKDNPIYEEYGLYAD